MADTGFVQRWERAADYVLAVLLAEGSVHNSRERWDKSRYENMLAAYHFPPGQWRMTYEAMETVLSTADIMHRSLVLTTDTRINQDWIDQRIALYSELIDGSVFYKHLSTLLDCGETSRVKGLIVTAGEGLTSGIGRDEVIADLMTRLASSTVETIRDETAMSGGAALEAFLTSEPQRTLSTGIGKLDGWTGGLGEDDVWAITGAYKMRKSTFARNIALNLIRQGASVAILMYESNRRMVAAQFVAMLGVEWLRTQGFYDTKDASGAPLRWRLNARDLVRVRAGYKKWDKRAVAAIDYGISEYKKMATNLRIYDKSADGGVLSDLASAHRVLLRDKRLYGADLAIVDHATQIMEQGKVYDRMEKIAPFFETFARRHKLALFILAQLNEDTVKGNHDNYSPGVKGGGDLPAAADFTLKTLYRQKEDGVEKPANILTMVMHLSRWGDGGANEKQELVIDPTTGLILGESRQIDLNGLGGAAS